MDGKINNFDEEQKKLASKVKDASDQAKIAAKHLREAKRDVHVTKEEKETLSLEQQELIKQKTKLDFTIKDLTDEVDGDNTSKVKFNYILHLKFKKI